MSHTVHYFGYGSLVNRCTRPANESYLATSVEGWQRDWSRQVTDAAATNLAADAGVQGYSVLSVSPAPKTSIEGVQVGIAASDLPALDAREGGYNRHMVGTAASSTPVAMYVSKAEHCAMASNQYPLLQSYVDCVLGGYLAVFDWVGVNRFIATTNGWSAPILNDRKQPIYSRAVMLPHDILDEFDALIAAAQ